MEGLVNKLQNVLTNESELLIILCESVIIYIEDPLYPFNDFWTQFYLNEFLSWCSESKVRWRFEDRGRSDSPLLQFGSHSVPVVARNSGLEDRSDKCK